MLHKNKRDQISPLAALFILFLGFGAYFGVMGVYTGGLNNVFPVVLGDDDGGGDDDDDDKDDDEDEDKDDDKDKKKEEKKKKDAEKKREDDRKKASSGNAVSTSRNDDDDEDEDEMEDDDSDEDEDENEDEDEMEDESDDDSDDVNDDSKGRGGDDSSVSGMYKEKDKTLEKLQKEIAKAEEDIMKQQAKGADVSVALAKLAAAKVGIDQVGASFDSNDLDAAKNLAKQIKKAAHFAEKDAKDAEKVAKEMADVEKRFGQVNQKIATYEGLGGDASVFKSQLASLQGDYSNLKASAVTPGVVTRDTVKAFEKRVKRLKSSVEGAILALGGGDDDDDLFDDHGDDADDLFEDLNDVAEIEDGDDNGVSVLARKVAVEHKSAANIVKSSLDDIRNRSEVAKIFAGPDYNALGSLTNEATAMDARAAAIEAMAEKIVDADMKKLLTDQATALRTEALNLRSYASSQSNSFSLFGWLFR